MKAAVRDAIAQGEKRAQQVEAAGKKMDKTTQWLINNKLNAEITKLRDETNASVESLQLQSKEARDQMKKEMLFAIRSASDIAKAELETAVEEGKKKFAAYQEKSKEMKD